MQFKYLSVSRTLFRNQLNPAKSCYRSGLVGRITIRGYYRSTASPFARPTIGGNLQMNKLPAHRLPSEILEYQLGEKPSAELQHKITQWTSNPSLMRANARDYIESLRMMIHSEDAADKIQLDKCNTEDVQLHYLENNEFFFNIKTPEMSDLCIYSRQFDKFTLQSKDELVRLDGEIILKKKNKIFVELSGDTSHHPMEDQLYDIVFHQNRTVFQMQHLALDFIEEHQLFESLINNPLYYMRAEEASKTLNETCEKTETLDGLNEEQSEAVRSIAAGHYYPCPFLLYGPPGTGKTKTLVAAIETIVRNTDKNLLVCAQTNAACDELTNRLRKCLKREEMLRFLSKSRDLDTIETSVKMYSNLFGGQLKMPPLKYICKYRVVICTLATANCLTRAQCDAEHFSYVVIDECASALETMALVPIAGLCTTVGKVHAKIVLAGDPKQLDAVVISDRAVQLGFDKSWMEQLFEFPIYQRNPDTGKYNSKYITQLVKNYRSHSGILHVPNQLFYDGVLEATRSAASVSDWMLDIPQLNPNCPIVFKSVQGICVKPENDTSSYNVEEIVEVMTFVNKLLRSTHLKQTDIGIISPYRLQCEMIRITCESNGLSQITVGTVETFQGQERKVIIASPVSSRNERLGSFVSDPQRLNVMATRAQYLLIFVGDPHTLCKDPNWSEFIKHCYNNQSLIQSDNHFEPEK